MLSRIMQYYSPDIEEYKDLEEWMKLSFFIGEFIESYKGTIKIYISIPSNLLFSYMTILGAVNYDFENISYTSMKEQYLQLKEGNKVYYDSNGVWKLCSILGIVPHPIDAKKLTIALLDHKKTTVYVPEDNWEKQIRINSLEQTEVRNAYKLEDIESIERNEILSSIYPIENIKRLQNRNTPSIHLFTNKKEWLESLSISSFQVKDKPCKLTDFIYTDMFTQFKNIDFISQTGEENIPETAIVIFIGASRSIRKMDEYKDNKCLYIIDRHENMEKIENLQEKIEQQIVIEGMQQRNSILKDDLVKANIELPKGVEIFAWE